ncbi:hypothetical protein ACFXQA_14490 [Microbacterium sp. P07]|uniref:hypothetical protein n=1 Tax=Microbacterium sp. P07 TaxID=3366952 RepID=UPI0037469096
MHPGLLFPTEELAARCNEVMPGADWVTVASLNSLFAGKRKSLSTSELETYASALGSNVLDLLYPPGEIVEVRPGASVRSADALMATLTPERQEISSDRFVLTSRAISCLEIDRLVHELEQDIVQLLFAYDTRRKGPDVFVQSEIEKPAGAITFVNRARWTAGNLVQRIELHRPHWHEDGPSIPAGVEHLLGLGLDHPPGVDPAAVASYKRFVSEVVAMRALFADVDKWRYVTGGGYLGEVKRGEHPAEA